MPDTRALLATHQPGQTFFKIVVGYVSQNQTAPASFADGMYVIVPGFAPSVPFGPLTWPASHGNTLPQAGDTVRLGFDDNNTAFVIAWDGVYS
jgi:hypothetical protein